MKKKYFVLFVTVLSLFLIYADGCIVPGPTNTSIDDSESNDNSGNSIAYIMIYLNNGSSEKVEYDYFNEYPNRGKDSSCTQRNYSKSDIKSIKFYSEGWDSCTEKNKFKCRIYYNNTSISLYMTDGDAETTVDCKSFSSGEYLHIKWKNISSIDFVR